LGKVLPQNKSFRNGISFNRELDCEVIQRIHQFNHEIIAEKLNLSDIEGENKKLIQQSSRQMLVESAIMRWESDNR
jgi:hypothetical protein